MNNIPSNIIPIGNLPSRALGISDKLVATSDKDQDAYLVNANDISQLAAGYAVEIVSPQIADQNVKIEDLIASQGSGVIGYAEKIDIPVGSLSTDDAGKLFSVTNDPVPDNNGAWRWDGNALIKSADRTTQLAVDLYSLEKATSPTPRDSFRNRMTLGEIAASFSEQKIGTAAPAGGSTSGTATYTPAGVTTHDGYLSSVTASMRDGAAATLCLYSPDALGVLRTVGYYDVRSVPNTVNTWPVELPEAGPMPMYEPAGMNVSGRIPLSTVQVFKPTVQATCVLDFNRNPPFPSGTNKWIVVAVPFLM